MPRYRIFVKEVRYADFYVTADDEEQARAIYDRSEEPDATFEEMGAVERGMYDEVTESEVEQVIQE